VETMPGGLLDRLLDTGSDSSDGAVRRAALAGAYGTALRAAGLGEPLGPARVAGSAWRRFAWHGAKLALPDGTARPIADLGPELVHQPRGADTPLAPDTYVAGRLLPELWYWRTIVSPHFATGVQARPTAHSARTGVIERARLALSDRPDLLGHLDLLAADAAARALSWPAAERHWRVAVDRLAAAGDEAGLAAAYLVRGDLRAAPLSSPLCWNCALSVSNGSAAAELGDTVERWELLGSQPADRGQVVAAYEAAGTRYAALSNDLGAAAVELRLGYLELVAGRPGRAAALATAARGRFERGGRPVDAAVAATHAVLAALADDRQLDGTGLVETLRAAQRVIGPGTVYGLALMCLRVGRYWAVHESPEHARVAFGLAEGVFESLGEREARVQSLLAAGAAAQAVGDLDAARAALWTGLQADAVPLAEPADPTDRRRWRRLLVAHHMFTLCQQADDIDGMVAAERVKRDTTEPLGRRLPGLTGDAQVIAEQLLVSAASPDWAFVEPFTRARLARRDGDFERSADLLARARAAVPASPPEERDMNEALVKAAEGDDRGASEAFARYTRRALDRAAPDPQAASAAGSSAVPGEGTLQVRQIHEEGLLFQLEVGAVGPARAHRDALAAMSTPWWAGLGPAWRFHSYDGRLRELAGDLPGALAALDHALEEVGRVRAGLRGDQVKAAFHGGVDVQGAYVDAARVALRLASAAAASGEPDAQRRWLSAAFGYLERGQSRALLDLMRTGTDSSVAGLPADLVARWRATSAGLTLAESRLARAIGNRGVGDPRSDGVTGRAGDTDLDDLSARLEHATAALRDVEADLRRADPRFWAAVNPQVGVHDLGTVAAALPPGVTLLQYAVGRRDLVGLAVTTEGPVGGFVARPGRDPAGLVARLVSACARDGAYAEPARELADLVLDPFRDVIAASTALVVVPGGPLMRLPFAVLPFAARPLGDQFRVAIAPNASALVSTRRSRPAGPAVVVGDPAGMVYRPDGAAGRALAALPGTRVEAVTVAGLVPGARLLVGPDATAEQVAPLLPEAALIHLATHGVLDRDSPLGSAVLLANGQSLTAAQLLGLRINAELVVLSACHTGDGGALRGGELLGIGRALLAAGAHAAMVTRWAVNDLSAALLMIEFHRLRTLGAPTADALRHAMRYLRELSRDDAAAQFDALAARAHQAGAPALAARAAATARDIETDRGPAAAPYDHPYHWAPFVLVTAGPGPQI